MTALVSTHTLQRFRLKLIRHTSSGMRVVGWWQQDYQNTSFVGRKIVKLQNIRIKLEVKKKAHDRLSCRKCCPPSPFLNPQNALGSSYKMALSQRLETFPTSSNC
jgi:hypothetical protein